MTIDESGSNRIVVVPGANLKYGVEDVKQIHHIIMTDVVLLQLEIPLETVSHAVEMAPGIRCCYPQPSPCPASW